MSTADPKKIPLYKQRPIQLIIGAGFALLLLGYLTSKPSTPEPKTNGAIAVEPAKASMGSAGQTAEFNQTFASRLREEQAATAANLEKNMIATLRKELGTETERSRLEAQKREEEFTRRLEVLTQAQEEAKRAFELRKEADSVKGLKFKAPAQSAALTEGIVNGQSEPAPATGKPRQGLQKTADMASSANSAGYQPVIPPNGFINGRLLNGVVATVGEAPTAFLVALEGYYRAANGYVVNLSGCHATVEGKPNLAAGRIDGKPAQISCNFGDEGRVQTWDVAGWVVDNEDGIRGLRSVIVDNTGKKIASSTLASTLAAAGAMLSQSQLTSTQSGSGTSTAMTGSVGKAVAGNALGGAGTGLQQALNEHFALYKPTLQKGGNAKVTIVITNELSVPREGSYITSNVNAAEGSKK